MKTTNAGDIGGKCQSLGSEDPKEKEKHKVFLPQNPTWTED